MQEVPTQEQQKESADCACDPQAGAPGGFRLYGANDAVSNQGDGRCRFGRGRGLEGYLRWWCWGWNAGCCWLRGHCGWIQCGCDLRKIPASAEAVGNDLIVGGWQCCAGRKAALLGQRLKQDYGEVVDVVGFEIDAFRTPGCFADAVTAKLDNLSYGKDIGWFDVFVDEVAAMQRLESGNETIGDLIGLFNGKGTFAEHFIEVGIGGLEKGVDERRAIDDGLAVLLQRDEVGLLDLRNLTPAVEDLGLIEMSFDQANDGWNSGPVCGGEEGAAPFGSDQLSEWEDVCDRSSFVVVPKLHKQVHSWGFWLKEEGPVTASTAKRRSCTGVVHGARHLVKPLSSNELAFSMEGNGVRD